jgi:hypothetical protein
VPASGFAADWVGRAWIRAITLAYKLLVNAVDGSLERLEKLVLRIPFYRDIDPLFFNYSRGYKRAV